MDIKTHTQDFMRKFLMHWHNSTRKKKVYFNILMYINKELNKPKLFCSDVNSLIQGCIVHEEKSEDL